MIDRESCMQLDQLENSVFVTFKDCLQFSTSVAYYYSTTVSLVVKQSMKVSSSLKQLIFVTKHTHTQTDMHITPITLPCLRACTHVGVVILFIQSVYRALKTVC